MILPFGFDTAKKYENTQVCNVEIRIEETLTLSKARVVIIENVKISSYHNMKIGNNSSP